MKQRETGNLKLETVCMRTFSTFSLNFSGRGITRPFTNRASSSGYPFADLSWAQSKAWIQRYHIASLIGPKTTAFPAAIP